MACEAAFRDFRLAGAAVSPAPERKILRKEPLTDLLRMVLAEIKSNYEDYKRKMDKNLSKEDSPKKKEWEKHIPTHARVLACRYVSNNGSINGALAGALAEIGYEHLLVVKPRMSGIQTSNVGKVSAMVTSGADSNAKNAELRAQIKRNDEAINTKIDKLKEALKTVNKMAKETKSTVDDLKEELKALRKAGSSPAISAGNNAGHARAVSGAQGTNRRRNALWQNFTPIASEHSTSMDLDHAPHPAIPAVTPTRPTKRNAASKQQTAASKTDDEVESLLEF
ncbi:hypothetical protein F53441_14160 [Fusarium austroafricanum]|uniref:Uncharacterized protein n=1 Tax=Fusarium austroafricanum TaxID=2364996 RepID=A0A8H4NM54_9HYPO|nr:hypothetical protein F53441_14160 [Fusarium austroafricanum]